MTFQIPGDPVSTVSVRTVEGLRVALAGLPKTMSVQVIGTVNISQVRTVAEARALKDLPCALEVRIPYRLLNDSVVILGESWI